MTVTPTSCEFARANAVLRIEVSPPRAQCPAGSERLKAIGNDAALCVSQDKPGWTAQQVTGRVRDQAFLVRVATSDRNMTSKVLRQKVVDLAEQVAGILF